jgi:hypothetical protein
VPPARPWSLPSMFGLAYLFWLRFTYVTPVLVTKSWLSLVPAIHIWLGSWLGWNGICA